MDLSISTTTYSGTRPNPWGSAHGLTSAESVTVDLTEVVAGDLDGDAVPGYLPEGLPLAIVTGTGLFAPYDPADVPAGIGTVVGLTAAPVWVEALSGVTSVPMVRHAIVIEANLPAPAAGAIDQNGKDDNPNIIYK